MIDHISLVVADLERSRAFYDRVLATLGKPRVKDIDDPRGYAASGYGASDFVPAFWVGAATGPDPATVQAPPYGQHVAFRSPDRASVDAFHREAMAAGGTDNGSPGLRPEYHADYYAAFVIDPDGYHIEAVSHAPD